MPFIEHIPPPKTKQCNSKEHNPPAHIVLPEGIHKWQCPDCGQIQTIIQSSLTWSGKKESIDYL